MLYFPSNALFEVLGAQLCPTLHNPKGCVAHQAPLPMEFSRQEYWSGLPFPTLENLSHPGVKPGSPTWQAASFTIWAAREAPDALLVEVKMLRSLVYIWMHFDKYMQSQNHHFSQDLEHPPTLNLWVCGCIFKMRMIIALCYYEWSLL